MEVTEQKLARAYLLGAYLGNGHCQWMAGVAQRPSYTFSITSIDEDFFVKIASCIRACFPQLQDRISLDRTEKKWASLRCHSKDLCQFLRSRCDIKDRLPLVPDGALFREFVAGLMDTDGWITQHYAKRQKPYVWEGWIWQMGFATTSPWYLVLRQRLQHEGVVLGHIGKVHKPKAKDGVWADCFNMYINIASFIDAGFYFSVARKYERLQNWQRHIRGESSETRSLAPALKPCVG